MSVLAILPQKDSKLEKEKRKKLLHTQRQSMLPRADASDVQMPWGKTLY